MLASSLHAVGQGAVAAMAGVLCRVLVGGGIARLPAFLAPFATPVGFAALALVAMLLKVAGGIVATYEEARLAGEVGVDLRSMVLDAWLADEQLRRARLDDHGSRGRDAVGTDARGVAALTERVREMEAGLLHGLFGGARAVLQLVPLAGVLILLAPKLALSAIAVLACFSLFLSVGRSAFKREQRALSATHEALLESADEAIRHADLWRTYGAEEKVRAHVKRVGERIAHHAARLEARTVAFSGTNEVLGALALLIALLAAKSGLVGDAQASSLLPFAVAFFLAYRPLRELAEARIAWSRATAATEEIALPPKPRLAPVPAASRRAWSLEAIHLRQVVLANGTRKSLSLTIEPGSVVAVVGANGSGKTTFLRMLLGLEPAKSGSISYGAERLDRAGVGPGHRPFAWVPQDAPLLADTLEANVGLAEDVRVNEAIATMQLAPLATRIAGARLGGGGRAVSGGERRSIAIARALASSLPVLLLDEPTTGLDDAAKKRLIAAIASLKGTRTVVIVAHDDAPVAIADYVVSLDDEADPSLVSVA
ncbi:MAG: ABC transporter ATP-binding protein/permease [Polyangiaceae bacterium]